LKGQVKRRFKKALSKTIEKKQYLWPICDAGAQNPSFVESS